MSRQNTKNATQPTLPFLIHQVSSEDKDYPASELLSTTSASRGWQTQHFAQFPQSLVVRFPKKMQLQSLQYLSHQCKIASKVEVYIALSGQGGAEPSFKKLGYFTLSNNETSKYQSRELKTVYIDAPVQFVKFVFQAPYANSINFFNQVGVISLSFFGTEIGAGPGALQGLTATEPSRAKAKPQTEHSLGGVDAKVQELIDRLEAEKKQAAMNEDYARANELKEQILKLKDQGELVARLEAQKQALVDAEDYRGAEEIKREIERLTGQKSASSKQNSNDLVMTENRGSRGRNLQRDESEKRGNNFLDPINEFDIDQPSTVQQQAMSRNNRPQNGPGRGNQRTDSAGQYTDSNDLPIPTAVNKPGSRQPPVDEYADQADDQNPGEVSQKRLQDFDHLSNFFDKSYLTEAFSTVTQSRILATEKLLSELDQLSQSPNKYKPRMCLPSDLAEIVLSCWKLVLVLWKERATQIAQNCNQIIDILLTLSGVKSVQSYLKNDASFKQALDLFFDTLQDKIGEGKYIDDFQWCERAVAELVNNGFITADDAVERLIGRQASKGRNPNNAALITGRLIVLQELVNDLISKLKMGLNKAVSYGVENIENANKGVRDQCNKLIVEIAKHMGQERTIKLLEQAKIKKRNLEYLITQFTQNEDDLDADQTGYGQPSHSQPTAGRQSAEDEIPEELEHENAHSQEDLPACQFCHLTDTSFANEDNMAIHLYKTCKALMICDECHQVIEITELNHHLLNECKNSESFTQCTRCLKAIPNESIQAHVSKLTCKLMRPDQKFPRCPLCLIDIPLKDNDWTETLRTHYVDQGCPNNPRN